jgi:hypothetical protein
MAVVENIINIEDCTYDPEKIILNRCGPDHKDIQCLCRAIGKHHKYGTDTNAYPMLTNIDKANRTANCPEKNCDYRQQAPKAK